MRRSILLSLFALPLYAIAQVLPLPETNPVWSVDYFSNIVTLESSDGPFWTETTTEYSELPFFQYGNTLSINDHEYTELIANNVPFFTDTALIRQEENKVFLYHDVLGDLPLYDFDMEKGDKITYYLFHFDYTVLYDSVELEVISKEVVNGRIEMTLTGDRLPVLSGQIKWIEGIGSDLGPLVNMSGSGNTLLQCFQLDQNITYEVEQSDSCGFQKNVIHPFSKDFIHVYAYPSVVKKGSKVHLQTGYQGGIPKDFEGTFSLYVYSLSGELITCIDMALNDQQDLETLQLNKGMYLVKSNFENVPSIRFVVQ